MNLTRACVSTFVAMLFVFSGIANAQDKSGFGVNIGVGISQVKDRDGSESFNANDFGYIMGGEYRFNENFALGLDGKVGINGNLTLDFTVNPDFGQVEADPSEVNLSAFETFFSEKRPFFIEGSNIFEYRLASAITGGSQRRSTPDGKDTCRIWGFVSPTCTRVKPG